MPADAGQRTQPSDPRNDLIKWKEWSRATFDEAAATNRLVLLDLSAEWCHWCHVMDQTTYSDPEVIRTINDHFIPVRVDIDKRPDISERYNRGGFPTTAFLSEKGESVWGATYVPPDEMKNVLKAMIDAKDKGEVAAALEQSRMQYLDLSKSRDRLDVVDREFMNAVFEDAFAAFDVEWGGFGIAPKFPHPATIDLMIERHVSTNDKDLTSPIRSTLDHMTGGLFDEIGGGVFRYSVTRDWKVPHYEKMLETNLGFLRNLVRAREVVADERFADIGKGVAEYLLGTLRDPASGAFFSSQDADEEYYKLDKDRRAQRPAPKVIKEIFSGLNCLAVSTLIEAGILLDREDWIAAALKAWSLVLKDRWDKKSLLVRHGAVEDLYLFEDQVYFLEALLSVAEILPESESTATLALAEELIKGVESSFSHSDGGFGDVRRESDAIGKLSQPERSIVANSRWARGIALLGAATFRPDLTEAAWKILKSFPRRQVQANGIFASDYVYAWDALELGPRSVEIHGIGNKSPRENELWCAAKNALNPATIVLAARKGMLETSVGRPFAVICKLTGCSKEIYEPEELASLLRPVLPGEI